MWDQPRKLFSPFWCPSWLCLIFFVFFKSYVLQTKEKIYAKGAL